jgi:magnesium transporter
MDATGHLSFKTAAGHATRDVPIVQIGQTIHDLRHVLVQQPYESASHIVVCQADRFRGVLTIEKALSAPM